MAPLTRSSRRVDLPAMATSITLAARQCLAALLALALTFAGVGHASAGLPEARAAAVVIAGVTVELCATGQDGKGDPTDAAHRHDCDQCQLCAPMALPGGQGSFQPAATQRTTQLDRPALAPHIARQRSPRQSQAPPVA